ncbi:maleylpyruvate isomerase N-terminal domain-containing protein [Streptomyces sp. NPDC050535]|uniref:maleylpyruvate isomerase N-terminal domain-containing protein n=1 Tax=Streptomyces sp. NPDC050535 TaxID=3365626 RepID=UPI0037B1B615
MTGVDGGSWNWRGPGVREAFLDAATSMVELLGEPAVVEAWEKPSALREYTVGGLAGHTAWQILFIPEALDAPPADGEIVSLRDYFMTRVTWIGEDTGSAVHVRIRRGGEAAAVLGPEALAARAGAALDRLRTRLPEVPAAPPRPLGMPSWNGWALGLDDFLLTRLLELVVHADDLAFSVGIPTPELPGHVTEPVVELLGHLAVRRHGTVNVLRGLSRAERAPASIAGI